MQDEVGVSVRVVTKPCFEQVAVTPRFGDHDEPVDVEAVSG